MNLKKTFVIAALALITSLGVSLADNPHFVSATKTFTTVDVRRGGQDEPIPISVTVVASEAGLGGLDTTTLGVTTPVHVVYRCGKRGRREIIDTVLTYSVDLTPAHGCVDLNTTLNIPASTLVCRHNRTVRLRFSSFGPVLVSDFSTGMSLEATVPTE